MLYLFNDFLTEKYWATPFINLLNCLNNIFNKKQVKCDYSNNNIINNNDILIVISATAHSLPNKYKKNKLIIINSESICLGDKSLSYMNTYINNPNVIQIWDYSKKNCNKFKEITKIPCYYMPITYDPYFESIYDLNPNIEKTIDICLFGCGGDSNSRRHKILTPLKQKGLNVWQGCVNGNKELSNILNKSKIVLIVHYYENDLPIDYYRICSLLSNKIFTIHECPTDDENDNSMDKILFVKYDNIVDSCCKYLALSQEERDNISLDIYKWWKINHLFSKYIPQILE